MLSSSSAIAFFWVENKQQKKIEGEKYVYKTGVKERNGQASEHSPRPADSSQRHHSLCLSLALSRKRRPQTI
jgi:hypothetical protein